MITNRPLRRLAAALALCACTIGAAHGAAAIVIINGNAPGIGFNDPTPATAVGGNTGSTLGEQRLIAFRHAAGIWGETITSSVPIRIAATFEPLPCSESSAVLGAAGAIEIFTDFTNAPRASTWYPGALASKIAGTDVASPGQAHIRARFNSRLGLS
ncbi:MAG: peptidase, partial [Telluria sp.]|nr:peptidase [Telluria sp.]